jgi:large subunit ribosomal protein L3
VVATQPTKSGMRKKKPDVFEIALGGGYTKKIEYALSILGKEISAKDIFSKGEAIDVVAVTKGYGFTGPVKRFGIKLQRRKDQQMHRHAGSVGSVTPRMISWTVPLAGQYGFLKRTEYGKRILLLDSKPDSINTKGGLLGYGLVKGDYILIEGSVPGTKKRLIRIRKSVRPKPPAAIEVGFVSTSSKQGA